MKRSCERCRRSFEAKTVRKRFCSESCRVMAGKARRDGTESTPAVGGRLVDQESESIADALRAELEKLGVLEQYEARTTLRLARQLDSGVIVGAAFVSQSKELDRRVDELRRRAPKQDDATQAARDAVQERRLQLASG